MRKLWWPSPSNTSFSLSYTLLTPNSSIFTLSRCPPLRTQTLSSYISSSTSTQSRRKSSTHCITLIAACCWELPLAVVRPSLPSWLFSGVYGEGLGFPRSQSSSIAIVACSIPTANDDSCGGASFPVLHHSYRRLQYSYCK